MLTWIVCAFWFAALGWTIVNLLLIRRIPLGQPSGEAFVSVVIPARNEEEAIGSTVRALLAQQYAALEVIVVDDCSTDGTRAVLAGIAAADPRLVVLEGQETPVGWLGKPWALHQGSLRARGELLLFVDADILYAPQAIPSAVAELERLDAAMIALFSRFEMRGLWEHAVIPQLASMAFMMLPVSLGNVIQTPVLAVGGGTGNLIRRDVYQAIGGHEALRSAVVDDVGLARHVRSSGHRSLFIRADHLVSVRMYRGLRQVVDGFTKNTFSTVERSYFFGLSSLVAMFVFHLLPWIEALAGNRVALATIAFITTSRLILFASLGYPLWSALLLHPLQTVLWMWIMGRSMWVTGIRGKLPWRGRTYDAAGTRFGAGR